VLTNVMAPVDDTVRDEFVRCAAVLADAGARLAVEYLPWTPVASATVAHDLVASVPDTGARVLPDVWHHFRGPDTWAELDALPLDAIAYVQFSDALPMTSDDIVDETVSRRVFPGEGEFDLDTYCEHLRAKGFDGVVSIEVLSAAMRDMDPGEFTRRAFAATSRYWG
jgi:sugar phosphate isomerase/epimerase